MLQIHIQIPQAKELAIFVLGMAAGAYAMTFTMSSEGAMTASVAPPIIEAHDDAQGGEAKPKAVVVKESEEDVRRGRIEAEILSRKAEMLRAQVRALEDQYSGLPGHISENLDREYRQSIQEMILLMQDREKAEEGIVTALRQIWEAQGKALVIGKGLIGAIRVQWPVHAAYGISAEYKDASYKERFGFEHWGVDIPVEQGTPIMAAAAGVVERVQENGLGFNSVTIRHDGFVTLYGHVHSFQVAEGQEVRAGQQIAASGGMPGTAGAGFSTGPHLHFEMIQDGAHIDPLEYLPALPPSTK